MLPYTAVGAKELQDVRDPRNHTVGISAKSMRKKKGLFTQPVCWIQSNEVSELKTPWRPQVELPQEVEVTS